MNNLIAVYEVPYNFSHGIYAFRGCTLVRSKHSAGTRGIECRNRPVYVPNKTMGNNGRVSEDSGDHTEGINGVGLDPECAQVRVRHVERFDSAVGLRIKP